LKFNELRDFISKRMKMQHIYQPVMIKTILASKDNRASVREIAEQFLQKDESQIEYYMQITKAMPGKVLAKHGIVKYESGNFFLDLERHITPQQRAELVAICDAKVDEYETARGRLIWLHRTKDPAYVPGSLRYQILKKAKFRCELCGISAEEKSLDVDHIVPRNNGGKTAIENLQALCYTCNSQKRDLDDTDFRPWKDLYENRDRGCVFCNIGSSAVSNRNALAIAFDDSYPVTLYHTLVTPNRHVQSFFEISSAEHKACFNLVEEAMVRITNKDKSVTGFNVGVNDGRDAGQTVSHCHVHLIPRRKGDVADPRGGIRNIIPGRGTY
jgi:diadenosine tetraphosphate (Ap4A) HIT family hydrolase